MPKTYITQEQRQRAQLSAWVFGQMKINQIRQRELSADRKKLVLDAIRKLK